MQHDQSKVTGLRKTERLRNARTPDRSEMRYLDMSTMSSVNSPKQSVHTSRMSMMQSTLNSNSASLRKMQLENNNLELELAYSDYVASYAELILEKKILKETEASFDSSIKKFYKETKSLLENCKLIQTRINDVKGLSCLQDYSDGMQSNINKFKDIQQKYEMQNILKQLRQLLDKFNILRCQNIIIPNTPGELEQFKKTLKDCCYLLTEVNDLFMCEKVENISAEYKEFLSMSKEISSVKKIVEEKICNLQIELLKSCSKALSPGSSLPENEE